MQTLWSPLVTVECVTIQTKTVSLLCSKCSTQVVKSSHYNSWQQMTSLLTVAHYHLLKCKFIQLSHPYLHGLKPLLLVFKLFALLVSPKLISHSPGLELSLPLFSCLVSCLLFCVASVVSPTFPLRISHNFGYFYYYSCVI